MTDTLITYYHRQHPAMQAALIAYWRNVGLSHRPESIQFQRAVATIEHGRSHG